MQEKARIFIFSLNFILPVRVNDQQYAFFQAITLIMFVEIFFALKDATRNICVKRYLTRKSTKYFRVKISC